MTINFTSNHRKTAQVTNPQQNNNLVQAQKLYGQFVNGERPEYQHDINQDPNMQQLNTLAERYKQSLSIADKKNLIDHERNILYEELEHPELTLARNYNDIKPLIDKKTTKQDVNNIITNFNIAGLRRSELLPNPFKAPNDALKINILEDTSDKVDNNGMFGKTIKTKINDIITYFKNGTLLNFNNSIESHPELISDLKQNYNQKEELTTLLLKAKKEEYPETTEIVNEILLDEKATPEIKQLAVWGAGKFRSGEGFKAVKEIALNTKEKDVRLREFAIHSTALYLRQKPDEVRNIMSQIEKDGSIFAPLGRIISDKVNGKYHGQKDREFKYANLSEREIIYRKYLTDGVIQKDTPLNIHRQNQLDRDLLMYRGNALLEVSEPKLTITNDTVTKYAKEMVGKRNFISYGLSSNSGDFIDTLDGINAPGNSIVNVNRIGHKLEYGGVAHEIGHYINKYFDEEEFAEQNKLYNTALKEGEILDSYAAVDMGENYAQGCEAMASVYKSHAMMINPRLKGQSHTKYELMAEHPNLYNFVKETIKNPKILRT